MEVVGESNYQQALSTICGAHTRDGYDQQLSAIIELEPSNQYDSNAVVVKIQGQVVGYLPREQAARVGSKMREEGLSSTGCQARVRGGWRTNQHDEGNFGVRLAIPQRGWIDFGTGRMPTKESAWPKKSPTAKRPEPADSGPLCGEWVAIIGAPSDGDLARKLAAQGARIMAGVGKSTTLLVVAEDRPFTPGLLRSAQYRKAEEQISKGASLRILSKSEVQEA
ncbi:MAG: HIRAN domain-containing protein [Pseudomonadota bacterium]